MLGLSHSTHLFSETVGLFSLVTNPPQLIHPFTRIEGWFTHSFTHTLSQEGLATKYSLSLPSRGGLVHPIFTRTLADF